MSLPALAIITAIGVIKTAGILRDSGRIAARIGPMLVLILVLTIGFNNINFYFYDYRIGYFSEDPKDEFSYEARAEIAPLHSQGRVYLISTPQVPYLGFENFEFFTPDVEKDYFETVTGETLAALPRDKEVLSIATPDRMPDLQLIQQWIPGGQWKEV